MYLLTTNTVQIRYSFVAEPTIHLPKYLVTYYYLLLNVTNTKLYIQTSVHPYQSTLNPESNPESKKRKTINNTREVNRSTGLSMDPVRSTLYRYPIYNGTCTHPLFFTVNELIRIVYFHFACSKLCIFFHPFALLRLNNSPSHTTFIH